MNRGEEKGTAINLMQVVFAVSEAMDLLCAEVSDHHRRVATVALDIARQFGLPPDRQRDLVLAAALHDIGAFSLRERLAIQEFEVTRSFEHADAGYRLLRGIRYFEVPAVIVRHHHLPWDDGRGEQWRGAPVPLESHILHLADRISVLITGQMDLLLQGQAVRRAIDRAGTRFQPELVQAFHAAAAAECFWLDALVSEAIFPGQELFGDVILSTAELKGIGKLFRQIIDFRSRFTATHSSGVAEVAKELARLARMTEEEATRISIAGSLHDLGKLSVPTETLEKERPLNRQERAAIIGHPYFGHRILGRIPGWREINDWANYHHERLDGSGYPFHIPGERLSVGCRIVAVADVFTALTEERPYRRGLSGHETLNVLKTMVKDGALDPEIVGLAVGHRETCNGVRHLAQQHAAQNYLDFCKHWPT